MLLNSYAVLEMIKLYRTAWFSGRYGGGKTALAFRVAYDLLDAGGYRYLLTNCASVWSDDPSSVQPVDGRLDAVVLLDEAGLFIRSNADAERFLAFLRKFNVVVLLASVRPPAPAFRSLRIQRVFDFRKLGVPLWLYTAVLRYESITERYWFMWWYPAEIYGIYDTRDIPVGDGGIGVLLEQHLRRELVRRGRAVQFQPVSVPALEAAGGHPEGAGLSDLVDALDSISEFVSLSTGGARRRR